MKIKFIKPSFEVDMLGQTGIEKLRHIEKVARLCYKTEDRITEDSYGKLVRFLVNHNHGAMLEHASFAVKFICSRDFSHELVRHRIASFAQESQRYVGYGDAIEFIIPPWCDIQPIEFDKTPNFFELQKQYKFEDYYWMLSMCESARRYSTLLGKEEIGADRYCNWKPEQARSVLPNATKTEIWINTNLRSWQNIFSLRDAPTAAPAMRELMELLHIKMSGMIPGVF